ncbi:hypothetical protein BDN72DRAFT_143826 [Pluteus cervinus]|uniref:Uncharacterized protein n=1 Tax=Pluteus cervinus TaxID=181527 RepID=A0ACD3ANP8_9AGAR|nr:hypothetical protein BDN72DRAFT_143826 [Pluteus cervinus]
MALQSRCPTTRNDRCDKAHCRRISEQNASSGVNRLEQLPNKEAGGCVRRCTSCRNVYAKSGHRSRKASACSNERIPKKRSTRPTNFQCSRTPKHHEQTRKERNSSQAV